ncbi:MAG: hypothetical protein ACREM8_05535, partial [Vulcanimicrobiaceae bacterium]
MFVRAIRRSLGGAVPAAWFVSRAVGYTSRVKEERPKPDAPAEAEPGKTVQLSANEEREVRKRTAVRAAVVFETVRREGETELNRPVTSLGFSGLAAGFS